MQQLGRGSIPRIYLFDGDWNAEDRALLEGTKSPGTGAAVKVCFLPPMEIENYLLVPDAIARAINELQVLQERNAPVVSPAEVEARMDDLMASDDKELFPQGKDGDPLVRVKGSVVFEQIFSERELAYDKKKCGPLIAKHVNQENQPAFGEICDILRELFAV